MKGDRVCGSPRGRVSRDVGFHYDAHLPFFRGTDSPFRRVRETTRSLLLERVDTQDPLSFVFSLQPWIASSFSDNLALMFQKECLKKRPGVFASLSSATNPICSGFTTRDRRGKSWLRSLSFFKIFLFSRKRKGIQFDLSSFPFLSPP